MTRRIGFVDQTLRDGEQSLWGLGMTPSMVEPLVGKLRSAGFDTLDVIAGTKVGYLAQSLGSDPWAMVRTIRRLAGSVKLRSAVRGDGVLISPCHPTLHDLFINVLADAGIDSYWIFDVLFNHDRLARCVNSAKQTGGHVVASVMFTDSPYHTDDYYRDHVEKLAELPIDGIYVEDTAGVITPSRVESLVPSLLEVSGDLTIELHFHNSTGLAPLSYQRGIEAGASVVHTSTPPLADSGSLPSTITMVRNLERLGYEVDIDINSLHDASELLYDYAQYYGFDEGIEGTQYDVRTFSHQIPGGMMGSMKRQLGEIGLSDRLDEILDEVARVREEIGYPCMATPFSQFVGTQAVLNVTNSRRYERVPDEIVLYLTGYYGNPVGPIDQDVRDRILSRDRAKQLEDFESSLPSVDDLRARYGRNMPDFEIVLRGLLDSRSVNQALAAGHMSTIEEAELAYVGRQLARLAEVASATVDWGQHRVDLEFDPG